MQRDVSRKIEERSVPRFEFQLDYSIETYNDNYTVKQLAVENIRILDTIDNKFSPPKNERMSTFKLARVLNSKNSKECKKNVS